MGKTSSENRSAEATSASQNTLRETSVAAERDQAGARGSQKPPSRSRSRTWMLVRNTLFDRLANSAVTMSQRSRNAPFAWRVSLMLHEAFLSEKELILTKSSGGDYSRPRRTLGWAICGRRSAPGPLPGLPTTMLLQKKLAGRIPRMSMSLWVVLVKNSLERLRLAVLHGRSETRFQARVS